MEDRLDATELERGDKGGRQLEAKQIAALNELTSGDAVFFNSFQLLQLGNGMLRLMLTEAVAPQIAPRLRHSAVMPEGTARALLEQLGKYFDNLDSMNIVEGA